MGVRAVWLLLLTTPSWGCEFTVDYKNGGDASGDPPADAAVATADAPADQPDGDTPVPDAAPPGPDAPPPADAGPPVTVSFGERPGSDVTGVTFDTYLSSADQTFNNGTDTNLYCSTFADHTCLLRFDLSSIPAGAQVQSATLAVFTGDDASPNLAQAFAVTEAWDEGTVDEVAGVSNWTTRQPGLLWTGEGCTPPSRAATPAGEFTPEIDATEYEFSLSVTVVQGWVDAPAQNFGLAIVPATDSNDFNLKAKDSSQNGRRPQLTITYVP